MKEISSTDTVYLAHILGIYNVSRWYPIFKKKNEKTCISGFDISNVISLTEITIRQLEFSFHWKQCPLNVGEKNMRDFYVPKIENSLIWRKKRPIRVDYLTIMKKKKSRIKKSNNAVNTYQFFHVWYFRTIQA